MSSIANKKLSETESISKPKKRTNAKVEKIFTPSIDIDNVKIYHQDVIAFLKSQPSESIDLIVTDPAYSGMNQHLQLGKGRIIGQYKEKGENGKWFEEFHDTPENYEVFLKECFRVLKKDRHLFIMFDSYSLITLGEIVRKVFNVKNIITWDKVNIGMGHYFRRQTEFIMFASKGKRPLTRKDIPDIWKIKRIHGAKYPTQKPVELFEAMIASSKNKNEDFVVCDPFNGSGSAAIASLKQNAKFIGCDISQKSITFTKERIEYYICNKSDIYQKNPSFNELIQKKFW